MRYCLFLVLLALCFSPAVLAQSDVSPPCALHEPDVPRPSGHGTILGFQDQATARAGIPRREAQRGGAIDPRYLDDLRAVVRQDNGRIDTFDVPAGVSVHVGQRVRLQGSYRSTGAPCSYVPHLVVPDDGPAV